MTQLERLKLAAVSSEFSDQEVEQIFLNLQINNEDDITGAINILDKHRPKVIKSIVEKRIKKSQ